MAVPANYSWQDPRERFDLGLLGGGALGAVHVESNAWAIACALAFALPASIASAAGAKMHALFATGAEAMRERGAAAAETAERDSTKSPCGHAVRMEWTFTNT